MLITQIWGDHCNKSRACKYEIHPSEMTPRPLLVGVAIKKNWEELVKSRSLEHSKCTYSTNEQVTHMGSGGCVIITALNSEYLELTL